MASPPQECRCPECGKLLNKVRMIDANVVAIEAYCKRCKRFVTVCVQNAQRPAA